jgi:4-hydroxythreonine-4-phosphate dehydrogenase
MAMQLSGFQYSGHTELLAERTKSNEFAMMLAGDRLRVVLVTIHVPLRDVPVILSRQKIVKTIKLAWQALNERFGIKSPRIAVSGLNPHAGEGGMFGDEEKNIIAPAIHDAGNQGFYASGPFPPDTIFYHAANKRYDAVISMYHDQGLIPFKLIHFNNGVNTTLGLPIIRTSVDHGTAYDIAGTGIADPGSLIAAINMAAQQAVFARKRQ